MNSTDKTDTDQTRIEAIADRVLAPLGFALIEAKLGQVGRTKNLEIIIYKLDGTAISLSDCETVSRSLDQALEEPQLADEIGFLRNAYTLDVSSPGIDRLIKHPREYQIFKGRKVEVKTKADAGQTIGIALGPHVLGTLVDGTADGITITEATAVMQQNADKKKSGSKGSKSSNKSKELAAPLQTPLQISSKDLISVRLYPLSLNKLLAAQDGDDDQDLAQVADTAQIQNQN